MANVVTNIASFEVDTSKAVQQTNNLINSLNKLQAERAELVKQGKSVAAIDKQIATQTQQLNALLNQRVKSVQGVNGQTKAYTNTLNNLSKENQKILTQQTQFNKNLQTTSKNLKSNRSALRNSVRGLRDFRTVLSFGLGGFATQLLDVEKGFKALESAINPNIQAQRALDEAVVNSTLEVAKEQIQLESLIGVANDDTRSKDERKAAIDKINEGYGKYLPNLLTEKDLNEDLLAVQDAVNKKIIEAAAARIKLAIIEEEITKTLQRQAAAQELSNTALVRGIDQLAGVDVGEALTASITADLQGTLDFIEQADITGFLTQTVELTKDAAGDAIKATQNTTQEVERAAQKTTSTTRQQIQLLGGSLADLEKQLAVINKQIREQTGATDTQALTPLIAQAQELQKQIDAAKKLRGELENPPKEERPTFLTNEIEALDVVRLRREDNLKALRRENEQLEINALSQQTILQNSLNEALKAEGVSEEEKQRLIQQTEEEKQRLDNETTAQILSNRIKILEIDRQIAEEEGESTTALLKQIETLKLELAELNGESIDINVNANTEEPTSKIEKLRNTVLTIADGVEKLGGEVATFFSTLVQNQISELDGAISKQKSALDALLANTETASAAQVEAERKRLEKLQEQREKATQKEQVIAKTQIALNAAVAVARAAAEGGGFASAITIAATLASLALGLTLANQQADQAFYEGTLHVKRGKGEKKGRDTVKAYLDEGEAVIPTATNKEYSKSVAAIFNKKVPSKILNSFVEGYQKGDYSPLTTHLPILTPTPIPAYQNNMVVDMGGLEREMEGLRRDNKELMGYLASLPRESHVFNERGYRKFVSQSTTNQQRRKNRYK